MLLACFRARAPLGRVGVILFYSRGLRLWGRSSFMQGQGAGGLPSWKRHRRVLAVAVALV